MTFTARRQLIGRAGTVPVRYNLRATTSGGRTRLAGRLKIRHRDYPGLSAVTALRTAAPS